MIANVENRTKLRYTMNMVATRSLTMMMVSCELYLESKLIKEMDLIRYKHIDEQLFITR